MNWGKSIVLSFILFAAFIGTLVIVCIRQDISLVSKDYYKEELQYDKQLTRLKNVSQLASKPVIKVLENKTIQITFDRFADMENGELRLFRPSDSSKDKKYSLAPTSNATQEFPTTDLTPGMYRAKMQWTMNGKEFFLEEVIFI
jgi:hypothetical protein